MFKPAYSKSIVNPRVKAGRFQALARGKLHVQLGYHLNRQDARSTCIYKQ